MSWIADFHRSSLGKKALMAATGIVLFGFVLAHMVGNLKLYLGAEHLNEYAAWLREIGTPALPEGGLLWIARVVLLVSVVVHMLAAWQVSRESRAARPVRYRKKTYVQADYATRTMRWGGVIIALFVVYHLMHLTWGNVHPDYLGHDAAGYHVFHNVVVGFSNPWVSGFYILANLALGLHLYHGLWSLFQTLGWTQPRLVAVRRGLAAAFAVVITAGNISFPLSVLSGLVSLST